MKKNKKMENVRELYTKLEKLNNKIADKKEQITSLSIAGTSSFICLLNFAMLHNIASTNVISVTSEAASIVSLLLSASCFVYDGIAIKHLKEAKDEQKEIKEELGELYIKAKI